MHRYYTRDVGLITFTKLTVTYALSSGPWVQDLHTIGTASGHETESADGVAMSVQQKIQRRLRKDCDS